MPKVTAWQCSSTKKLFATESAYEAHMAKRRRDLKVVRERERKVAAIEKKMSSLYECTSFDQISQWLIDNNDLLVERMTMGWLSERKQENRIIRAEFSGMGWHDELSCSHSSPFGRPSNWCGRGDPLPRGYPGWYGRFIIQYDTYHDGFAGDRLKGIGINTGTGGSHGGSETYSWDVSIWAEDFPAMQKWENQTIYPLGEDHHMLKTNSNTVELSVCEYYDNPSACHRRNGSDWKTATGNVLHPDVYWWLRNNVGREYNESWDVDRHFYPEETLPVLPHGAHPAWMAAGHRWMTQLDIPQRWYSHHVNDRKIYFDDLADAQAFRERFGIQIANADLAKLTDTTMMAFTPVREAVREITGPLYAVAVTKDDISTHPFVEIGNKKMLLFADADSCALARLEASDIRIIYAEPEVEMAE